ncbi:MAG: hypothetical protein Q4C47_02805, partial [Planctomycetia bacterium]|nr:hypothetical protein [Planctomycetia bacterium]
MRNIGILWLILLLVGAPVSRFLSGVTRERESVEKGNVVSTSVESSTISGPGKSRFPTISPETPTIASEWRLFQNDGWSAAPIAYRTTP